MGQVSRRPLTISAQYGLIDQSEFFDRQIASKDMSGYYLLKKGEFAYNKSYSNDYPWGAVKRLDTYECGALSTLYICFNLDNSIVNSDFISHYFETNKWHKGVSDIAGEGARNHGLLNMSVEDYFLTKHYLPSLIEQEKISYFLNLITARIETQSKIIEKLQSQMLAIYHQVFSQLNSEVLPLVKLCSIQKGAQVNGIELLENGPYYFMNGGIVPSGFYNDWNTETNTISISEGGNSCGYVQYNKERFWSGGHCYTLQKLNKVSVRYLYHFLKSYEKDIMRLRIGTGLPNIQKKDLEQFLIKVPSLLEQERLVKLLDSFELKIGTEEKLFKKYKEQKKFLLSNMFI